MKRYSVLSAFSFFIVVMASLCVQGVQAQGRDYEWYGVGWTSEVSVDFTGSPYTPKVKVPLTRWQLKGAPEDNDDSKMESKRYPETAKIYAHVYYAYINNKNKYRTGHRSFLCTIDWDKNEATFDCNFGVIEGVVTSTIVLKVPGYNKDEGESVFINIESIFAGNDKRTGSPQYNVVFDLLNKKYGKVSK